MALLSLNDVSIQFGGLRAVDGVVLEVRENEILSLIGPNGAGKTTVFNLITGIYPVSSGEISYKDQLITKAKPYERTRLGIARTFQNIRLFKQLTVAENIILGMHSRRKIGVLKSVFRMPSYFKEFKEANRRADEVLEYVNLLNVRNEKAENLPYGKQRELEIVRAIATGAELLLLDEPAAGMNPHETIELMHFIEKIRKDMKKSILLIEHDMHLVMNISDRVAVLDYGRLIAEGLPSEMQNDPKVIEAYLGKGVADAED